jgi:hypothetical protein
MANLRRRIPQQTESLFTENHEPFFNSIGQERRFPEVRVTSAFPDNGQSPKATSHVPLANFVKERVRPLFAGKHRCGVRADHN